MNSFEERRARRIQRLLDRAQAKSTESGELNARALGMADIIPMGQPILVGHHSEGRDRRYRAKINRTFTKAAIAASEAVTLQNAAHAAQQNTAISSDDPDAVGKLKQKLEVLNAARTMMIAANRAVRKGEEKARPILVALGLREGTIADLFKPDCFGALGFPDYRIKNSGAEARRLEKRIKDLEARAQQPAREPVTFGDVAIEEDDNRVRVRFPGKPSHRITDRLKAAGFHWTPSLGVWQRMASNQAWYHAIAIAMSAEKCVCADSATSCKHCRGEIVE